MGVAAFLGRTALLVLLLPGVDYVYRWLDSDLIPHRLSCSLVDIVERKVYSGTKPKEVRILRLKNYDYVQKYYTSRLLPRRGGCFSLCNKGAF